MALTLRVLTWNFTDIQQNPRHATVSIAPSQLLTDPAGMVVVPASPQTWNAYGSGSTNGGLVTTDSAGIAQTGWYYNFVISADGMPDDEFAAFLPSGSGALDLTELVQTEPVAEMAAYALASALAAETARAEAAEATLAGEISSAGDVLSVNTQTGAVVLDAADVGADAAGAAAGALASAETFTTSAVAAETARAETAEGALTANLASEVTNRAAAVSGAIATAETFAAAAVASETTRAEGAESTSASAITAETTRAESAEALLASASALTAEVSRAEAAEALKAPLASPALTGSPTAPTQTTGDSSTKIATDQFVTTAVAAETTRAEAAEATLATSSALAAETSRAEAAEALLAPLASPAFTGTPTAPTRSALTSNTDIATTAYADSAAGAETSRAETAEALRAPLASPALTGTPTAPTATALTSSTQVATTAYADSATGVEKTRALAAEALLAPLASPALTGSPTAPTKTALTSNTDIATTAYADSAVAVETSRAETAEGGKLTKANSLSELTATASTARTNLGLGSAATASTSAFDAAGAAGTAQANAEAASLPLTGGTMSGAIAMGANKITGVANGSGAQDAAAFGQLPTLSSLGALASAGFGLCPVASVIAQSFPWCMATAFAQTPPSSGYAWAPPVTLSPGQVISNISFCTGSTASTTLTHWWCALYRWNSGTPMQMAHSADQGTATVTANTVYTLAMVTPYTIPSAGTDTYYLGLSFTGGMPSLATASTSLVNATWGNGAAGLVRYQGFYHTAATPGTDGTATLSSPTAGTYQPWWVAAS